MFLLLAKEEREALDSELAAKGSLSSSSIQAFVGQLKADKASCVRRTNLLIDCTKLFKTTLLLIKDTEENLDTALVSMPSFVEEPLLIASWMLTMVGLLKSKLPDTKGDMGLLQCKL